MEMTPKLKQAVKDYKAGKAESFDCLYKESEKYIYTCIFKIMSGNSNALDITEEVMQDTYLEIFLNISQLENEDRFLSWAGTIASRKCFAYIKKNKKYILLDEEDNTFENLSDRDEIIPEEVMQSKEKQRLVREIIDTQLTEVQKICIYEFFYNQKKQSEIAGLYGMPVNTVKTNLSRAKVKIEEGIVYLEKKKDTKLYSFTPLFVLLFTEDVMAAEVPTEISESVLSGVADAVVKAAEAGVGTAVSGASEVSTASAAGASSSATAKVGLLGKIAAASTKAKILMVVVTVSVGGTIGAGVMAASQSGLFQDASAVNENQEIMLNQEVDEKGIETETGEILSTEEQAETEEILSTETEVETESERDILETLNLENKGTTGVETCYSNGTSDYEIWHTNSQNGVSIHYIVINVMSGAMLYNADNGTKALLETLDESTNYEGYKLYVSPLGNIEGSNIVLKNMSDAEISGLEKNAIFLGRTESENQATALIQFEKEFFIAYYYFVNDYATGQTWTYLIHATESYASQEMIETIINNIEIVEIIQ